MFGFLIAGLIIGALARMLSRGRHAMSLTATLVLGVLGSVVGGTIANILGTGDIFELNVIGFVVAVISSVALLGAARRSALKG